MADIRIYGLIVMDDAAAQLQEQGNDPRGMVTPTGVAEQLDAAAGHPVNVRMNSPGGHAEAGFAMGNILAGYKGPLTVWIDALAASAASIAISKVKDVAIADNAGMMVHSAAQPMIGIFNTADLREQLGYLEKLNKRQAISFAGKTNKTQTQWTALLETGRNYLLTAAEAVSVGLARRTFKAEGHPKNNGQPQSLAQMWAEACEGMTTEISDRLRQSWTQAAENPFGEDPFSAERLETADREERYFAQLEAKLAALGEGELMKLERQRELAQAAENRRAMLQSEDDLLFQITSQNLD